MRIIQLMLVFMLCGAGAAMAQANKQTLVTAKIKVPTVQCNMCKDKIQRYFLKEEGVKSMVVDVKKKEATVKYYTDRTNIENIKTGIANAGYDADDVTANEDSYNDLPKCCKKPEDGGGPVKKKG
ncbi:heavy-metal-associated domain-containing protein [Chitinophaga barathri]|uniref:Copper chaperone n=1 Tax=Chitinophaga barathri TaxID=1647451 RepID=A0A3N4ME26_9BACT|nr:cation transporter [Chitinophaga barathri]RPD41615.1 copper chaperone [Chitinophaga barathri]